MKPYRQLNFGFGLFLNCLVLRSHRTLSIPHLTGAGSSSFKRLETILALRLKFYPQMMQVFPGLPSKASITIIYGIIIMLL